MYHSEPDQQSQHLETLEKRLAKNIWGTRKQVYEQLYDLIDSLNTPKDMIFVGGKQYDARKLIQIFEDLVDEQHPSVLLVGLDCVIKLLERDVCSNKSFVKLLDKGFDRFPLRISRGKQIMQKFAQIIELIGPEPNLIANKFNSNNDKCIMYALEVAALLNLKQLMPRIKQISLKHSKKSVKQVAKQIYEEMIEQSQQQMQEEQYEENDPQQNNTPKKSVLKNTKSDDNMKKSYIPSKSEQTMIEKLQHYQQLNSKQLQKYSESLLEIADKLQYFPQNQLTNLSHVLRLMIDGSNFVINCSGIKILKILIQNKSNLIPRSYPLLFLFSKFKMHPSHQINTLLFETADSLFVNQNRALDLIQAILDGSSTKKANVRYGCVMLLIRLVCIIAEDVSLFESFFQNAQFKQIHHSSQTTARAKKMLNKCFDNLYGTDKKLDQSLNQIRSIVQTFSSSKTFSQKKSSSKFSNVSSKIENKPSMTSLRENNQKPISSKLSKQPFKRSISSKSSLSRAPNRYKIINPEQTLTKVLRLCQNNSTLKQIKKTIETSLTQIDECIIENRFQLFYYAELIHNFVKNYQANEQTSTIISQFIISLLLKVSKIGQQEKTLKSVLHKKEENYINLMNIQSEGVSMILKICLGDLYLGKIQLETILNNLSGYGVGMVIKEGLMNIESKIKKKNRKILLSWIDSNVSHQELNDDIFELMEKIEKGQYVGTQNPKHQYEAQIQAPEYLPENNNHLFKNDINILENGDLSQIEHRNNLSYEKTFVEDDSYLNNLRTSRKKYPQEIEEPKQHHFDYDNDKVQDKWKQCEQKYLKKEQERNIKQDQDQGQGELTQYKKQWENNNENAEQKQAEQGSGMYLDIENYKKYIEKIRNSYLPAHKKEQSQELSEQQVQSKPKYEPQSLHFKDSQKLQHQDHQSDKDSQSEEDKFKKLEERLRKMKEFAANTNDDEFGTNRADDDNCDNEAPTKTRSFHHHIDTANNSHLYNQEILANENSSPKQKNKKEEEDIDFSYRVLNASKVAYMLRSTSNPYSHLRNQILVPFKNHTNKSYFLKELAYFLTEDKPQLVSKFPQPYNAILLLVILLFAEIQSNKELITPLQQLYQHMASLCSTNDFLKTIISLFHCVIEETPVRLRTFLITILTKSVSRLMIFAEDPVMLLRDLSQFYNIGENVYFEMYESQYLQIRKAIEGQCLEQVVEKALLQQGENLIIIVESWFETSIKEKVKQYMSNIIRENEEDQDEESYGQRNYEQNTQ